MVTPPIVTNKVKEHHTKKRAYHYIRQSDDRQVRENTGSTEVQMAMREQAIAYGFDPENIITVISDQGHSGRTSEGREGFKRMLRDIALGLVGAVFCSHTSRVARNAKDMQQLIAVCEATDTLIIDGLSVFDPNNDNDWLVVNIKGVLDEADGRRLAAMLWGAKVAKARQGKLRTEVPTGFKWVGSKDDPKLIWEPDQRVQQAILRAFDLLPRLGSGMKVVKYCNEKGYEFPTRMRTGVYKGQHIWGPHRYSRLLKVYHDPIYMGSYVMGQYTSKKRIVVNEDEIKVICGRTKRRRQDWLVHIPNFHKGYITPEQFERNQELLSENRSRPEAGLPGAVRGGSALLPTKIFCGRCGKQAIVKYPKRQDAYNYICKGRRSEYDRAECQYVSGNCVDEAVTKEILKAFRPTELEASVEAANQIKARESDAIKEWQLRLQSAKFDAEEAKVRFDSINPRNKLVAEEYQNELQKKKEKLKGVESEYEKAMNSSPRPLDLSQLNALTALACDIPKLWYSEGMTQDMRKRLVRTIIDKIVVTRIERIDHILIYWRTGAITETSFQVKTTSDYKGTDRAVLNLVRELALKYADPYIANILNDAGHLTAQGNKFTTRKVYALRAVHGIPSLFPGRPGGSPHIQRGDGRYAAAVVAPLFKRHVSTILAWCAEGRLDAIRQTPNGTWWIKLTPEQEDELKSLMTNSQATNL